MFAADSTPDARPLLLMTGVQLIGIALLPVYLHAGYALIWLLLLIWMRVYHVPVWRTVRSAGIVLPFTLAASTLLFTTRGQPIGNLPITDAGLLRFAAIVMKAWLSAQAVLLLTQTYSFSALLNGLIGLGLPAVLADILLFTYRYILVVQDEARRMLQARTARSMGRTSGTLRWRATVAGNMVGSLFLRSYERAERIYAAMVARGYQGTVLRTAQPALRPQQLCLAAITAGGFIIFYIVLHLSA